MAMADNTDLKKLPYTGMRCAIRDCRLRLRETPSGPLCLEHGGGPPERGSRVLVSGGRAFNDRKLLNAALDGYHNRFPIDVIIHGKARGADKLAGGWAAANDVDVIACPANWTGLGRSAGIRRNTEMFRDERPDAVIAFPGGRGTGHMIGHAFDEGAELWLADVRKRTLVPCRGRPQHVIEIFAAWHGAEHLPWYTGSVPLYAVLRPLVPTR